MKAIITTLALLVMPALVQAQANDVCVGSSPCYTPTADEIAAQVEQKLEFNERQCARVALPSDCTQAQYDAAGGVGVVYASSGAGTRAFFLDKLKADIAAAVSTQRSNHKSRAQAAWDVATPAQRQAACQALGKGTDCK